MKLSVSAFRAQATAQRKILKPYQNQLNYGTCSSRASGFKVEEVPRIMVDKTGVGSSKGQKPRERCSSPDNSGMSSQEEEERIPEDKDGEDADTGVLSRAEDPIPASDRSPRGLRTKSNQRWMKLRTTVQLSGAISNTIQKSKPPLKREDSFLKRFSTRQVPEAQETADTGDETEAPGDPQGQEEVNRRRRKRRKELSRTVVNPDENFHFYWLLTVTVSVLYNLWTLIVRQSFPELQKGWSRFWYACDGITDVVFVCDILVQFRTGYLEQGLMVYNSKKLAGHYLKSRAFIFDLLALLPLDLLQINMGANPILRFPRFLKIYRVYSYYYIVESRTVYPNLWRVVNLIHILLILAHWFGCFYYLLSEAENFQGAWVYPYRQGDDVTLTRKYLGSLYWSTLTLTTIGDLPTPETNAELQGRSKAMTSPEDSGSHTLRRRGHKSRLLQFNSSYGYIFTIVSYLIGVFIFATIVGQVGNVITNRNANRLEFERLLDGAKTYMRHHKVPGGMKRRVLRWYDYSWSRGRIQGGGDINTALGLLPDKLKTELALHVNLSVLKKVTIFQECQPEFLHDLVLKMKAYIFTPGDLICRKGEIAREMFIIADGILDVISETGRVLTTMKAGDFFGEIGILNLDGLNKRTADVRSVGYSELFSLSREDVLTAMKDYPEAQEILQSLGRKRLMEAKNASKAHKYPGKQTRENDSPGDSDNAGKRIVEKLRSDVKGLKNALRRSRRDGREESDGGPEGHPSSGPIRKHSVLRRMSHVQSSDECEVNSEAPIGAGLPLLQRLKLLKEKQDRAKEEASRVFARGGAEPESTAASRLVSLSEKDDSEEDSLEEATYSEAEKSRRAVAETSLKSLSDSDGDKMDGELEEPRTVDDGDDKSASPAHAQEPEMPRHTMPCSREVATLETSIHVPKSNGNTVPKQVPNSKDRWDMLKKSSRTEDVADDAGQRKGFHSGPYGHGYRMKKYKSIDDLSPEYSGLPFVKKLKILNERQKLAELTEKELVVRSASLDVPEKDPQEGTAIVRSRSIDTMRGQRERMAQLSVSEGEDSFRTGSNASLLSPESNETFERRHLKSILKKLSADESTSDEDRNSTKGVHRSWSLRRADRSDLKRLMRAPTVEGYVARHTKLSKSVTFDRDALQSPTNAEEENAEKGVSPTSPTAILTLQPSNLSMPPVAGPSSFEDEEIDPLAAAVEEDDSRPSGQAKVLQERSIEEAVQVHLDAINGKIQSQFREFEFELRKRDETIRELRMKIAELQGIPKATEYASLEGGPEPLLSDFRRRALDFPEVCPGRQVLDKGIQALAWDTKSPDAEEVELLEFVAPLRGGGEQGEGEESRRQKVDSRTRGGLMNRVADFRRSLSRSNDFVTLEIDLSSNSSDSDDSHNKDWEVQMLAEELSRKERERSRPSDESRHEEMKRLEREVNTLKEVVCERDLNCFTASELDLLEMILEAKDQRISEIASSSCFDIVGGREARKPSLRRGLGQALSFDFHDMDNRKRRDLVEGKSIPAASRKAFSYFYGERQSLDNLLHSSSLLRSRVLDDTSRGRRPCKNTRPRSSLPLIASQSLAPGKNSKIRASLPSLPRRRAVLNECATSSLSSCEDAAWRGGDARESYDSASDENRFEMENLLDVRGQKSSDGRNALNNFIKIVGQRVKHAVVGDADPLKDQVPTISKLCDERSLRRSRDTGGDLSVDTVDEEPREEAEEEEGREGSGSKCERPFDCVSKMESHL